MKKYLTIIIFAVIVGFLLSQFFMNQYEKKEDLLTIFSRGEKVYLIQQGVYTSEDNVKKNTMGLDYYVYSIQNDMYYVYIAITKNVDNIPKIQGYFKNLGYDTLSKEIYVNNKEFLEILSQYDNLLLSTSDNDVIKAICSQTLGKYEELILDAYKD